MVRYCDCCVAQSASASLMGEYAIYRSTLQCLKGCGLVAIACVSSRRSGCTVLKRALFERRGSNYSIQEQKIGAYRTVGEDGRQTNVASFCEKTPNAITAPHVRGGDHEHSAVARDAVARAARATQRAAAARTNLVAILHLLRSAPQGVGARQPIFARISCQTACCSTRSSGRVNMCSKFLSFHGWWVEPGYVLLIP